MGNYISNKHTSYDRNHTIEEHLHAQACVYPTLAGGVSVTGAAGAWTLGNFVEIVPVNTITDVFDIHWITIEDASASDEYELVLYAATTEIGRVRFNADTGVFGGALPAIPFQCEQQLANTQIQAKLANSGGGSENVVVSISYHTY